MKKNNEQKKNVISAGNDEMDFILDGGFKRKEINVVASRPGDGKTTFLFNLATHFADDENLKVYYLHTDAFDKKYLRNKNIQYEANDSTYYSNFFEFITRRVKYDKIDVLIIDTLNGGRIPWCNAVEYQFSYLYEIAKKYNIAVIVSVLVNRDMYKRKSKQPMVKDLRIIGKYDAYIDNILFIKRDYINLLKDETPEDYDWHKRTIYFYDKNKKEYAQMETKIEYSPKYGGECRKEELFKYLFEEFKQGKIKTD